MAWNMTKRYSAQYIAKYLQSSFGLFLSLEREMPTFLKQRESSEDKRANNSSDLRF